MHNFYDFQHVFISAWDNVSALKGPDEPRALEWVEAAIEEAHGSLCSGKRLDDTDAIFYAMDSAGRKCVVAFTPLAWATRMGLARCVERLLAAGANPEFSFVYNEQPVTLLDMALARGFYQEQRQRCAVLIKAALEAREIERCLAVGGEPEAGRKPKRV